MKRMFLSAGVILIVLFAGVLNAEARDRHHHRGFRGGVILGPVWTPWPYAYPYSYYPYSYGYRDPAIVIEQDPPEYIQRDDEPEEQYYWYFCDKPKGYYPYVTSCPDGWKKVLPAPPSDGKE